jgi:hypothetical protein
METEGQLVDDLFDPVIDETDDERRKERTFSNQHQSY